MRPSNAPCRHQEGMGCQQALRKNEFPIASTAPRRRWQQQIDVGQQDIGILSTPGALLRQCAHARPTFYDAQDASPLDSTIQQQMQQGCRLPALLHLPCCADSNSAIQCLFISVSCSPLHIALAQHTLIKKDQCTSH